MRLSLYLACVFVLLSPLVSTAADYQAEREQGAKLMKEGNWKDAGELFKKITLAPDNTSESIGGDLNNAIQCLMRINQISELDELVEKAVEVHPENWRLLQSAANIYNYNQHGGFMIGGEFKRGHHRGGGKYVNSMERDRVRSLQLMEQGLPHVADAKASEQGQYYLSFAGLLQANRGNRTSWHLQYLTDLSELPDYEDGYGGRGGSTQGAPVDEEGNPIFYQVPKGWDAALSDGERWRWMLTMATEASAALQPQVRYQFAMFLQQQFGVSTLRQYQSWFWRDHSGSKDKDSSDAIFALDTLKDSETIARLATGIKRFTLPDEFNYLLIYKELDKGRGASYGQHSASQLANIYQNRRQFPQAAMYWKRLIEVYQHKHSQNQLDQIIKPWGRFEPGKIMPAGEESTLSYRFRNGRNVSLKAHEIKVEQLLLDVQAYLKTNPGRLDWQQINIGNIGYRLVQEEQAKYIGKEVASWEVALTPQENHFDSQVEIKAPISKAGAYLITSEMADGNTSRIILWLSDTVLAKKQLHNQVMYFVADAVTGQAIEKANLEFFGYRTEHLNNKLRKALGRQMNIHVKQFAEFSNADGTVVLGQDRLPNNHNWLVIARKDDRMAYLGFQGVWYNNRYDNEYNQRKGLYITDRPVYRPAQPVKLKAWIRNAKYDKEFDSAFAGSSFTIKIRNPKGEEVFSKALKTDAYGGFETEYPLADDATLGVYSIWVPGISGQATFRVEEYKKPEFEVTIDAPSEPVKLGDSLSAKVTAKYYFGAPVVNATVKYKVMRTSTETRWYPAGEWDWFYGTGYWWYAYDYIWYPGWHRWGCYRPAPWWQHHSGPSPEMVMEGEVEIGPDGTLTLPIDTSLAKEIHGDTDHRYSITAEVTDDSRRTIVGTGAVLAARQPYRVYTWIDRGYYKVKDTIKVGFNAQTPDGKPVVATGTLTLYKVTYDAERNPQEEQVQQWKVGTGETGRGEQQITASAAGQFRLSTELTDAKGNVQEGAYIFTVRGQGFDSNKYRFNAIELMTDKQDYQPGDTVELVVNTNQPDATVLLFIRPVNGICLPPTVIRMKGKSHVENITITKKDMPNFFVEALTIANGQVYSEMREIIVPPEKRVLNVEIKPDMDSYKPGQKAKVDIHLTDFDGQPYSGSTVISIYDKSVEYISGGTNIPEIREYFWKWRRSHNPNTQHNLAMMMTQLLKRGEASMNTIGMFGGQLGVWHELSSIGGTYHRGKQVLRKSGGRAELYMAAAPMAMSVSADMVMEESADSFADKRDMDGGEGGGGGNAAAEVDPTVRSNFADTAYWAGAVQTDEHGNAQIELDMPENLTTWMIRTWAMGHGTRVGQGSAEVVTTKNLLLRLQAPRFFVEKDEVVLSANIHNYLPTAKKVRAVLELEGGTLEPMDGVNLSQMVSVEPTGETRVDWRIKVVREGEAIIRMKALTDEESDAMELTFPVKVHGIDKMVSLSGQIAQDQTTATAEFEVPVARRVETGRLEVRYSPTLAGAMVDALPYLLEFPYGCTEQTLNRFLPAVITQKVLMDMGLDLKEIRDKLSNLNAQEIGDDQGRAAQWQKNRTYTYDQDGNRIPFSPVFDHDLMQKIVKDGVDTLTAQQLSDGGWGWFSGYGERSYPHTTATVVRGLMVARDNDVALVPGVLERGIQWLATYQANELEKLNRGEEKDPKRPYKINADNLDALVYMILVDAKQDSPDMREHLYKDRNGLAVYAKSMLAMATHKVKDMTKRDMLIRNIEQYLVKDAENQTAYLNLGNEGYWWYWYGSEYEAHAYYLKLLALTDPKGETAPWLVKYLLNNRKHATYWKSTRDTAIVIESFADFMRASGEDKPDLELAVKLDGQTVKTVKVDRNNLFTFDNKVVLTGKALKSGKHTLAFEKKGTGPIYFNAYVSYFSLDDYITKAGLEIKVERKYYKLVAVDKTIKAAGSRGQAVDQKVEKFERQELADLSMLKSGDKVEIELVIESKNDYEYIIFEDYKAAGFEPIEVRSGYSRNGLGAYMELRDDRVAFFVRSLARGKHSISYRMRAEIPGKFSALPTRAWAMYAPELRANADEIKLQIED